MPVHTRLFVRFLLCLLPAMAGCASAQRATDAAVAYVGGPYGSSSFDLASTPTFYTDGKIYRGEMQVMVHPNINLEQPPTALFVPLGVTQEMRDASAVSQGVSRQVWQQFLREGTFSALEYANTPPPYQPDAMLPYARQKGAAMLVGGYITYYFDGGMGGDTKISLQIEVYDVKTGNMLWSMGHAATLPYKHKRDFLLLEVKSRMPADPMAAVIAVTSADMARLLHMWTSPKSFTNPKRANVFNDSAFGKF